MQKTAYEMRISDWSSDVCSSDLFAQFEGTDNMTDRQAALTTLANGISDARVAALDIFYNRYSDNALVPDKWFSTQALDRKRAVEGKSESVRVDSGGRRIIT